MEFKEKLLNDILEINPKISLKKGVVAKKIAMEHLYENVKYIQGFELTEFKSGSKFKNQDTLVARITPCLENGKTAYVNLLEENEIAFGSTEFFVIRAKEGKGDPQFIYYLMRHPKIREAIIKSMTGTSGRQRAHKEAILNYSMYLPNLNTQKKIGDFLSLFDSKIETNKNIIRNLEKLSQTLFKQWFIDFEFPNEKGQAYKSSGGEMIESELGNVPAEWNTYNVGDFVESISQSINKKEKKSAKFLNTSDILAGEIKEVNFLPTNDMPGQAKKMIKNNDILFSEIRPKNRRYAYVDMENPQDYVVSTKLMVLRVNEELFSSKLFYIWLTLPSTINELNHIAESRSGTFPQITFSIISKLKLALPPKKHFTELEASFIAMFNKIDELRLENKALSKLRDTLLPKLLSGEIEIPDELEV